MQPYPRIRQTKVSWYTSSVKQTMSSHLPMLAHLEIIAPDDSHRHDFCSHLAFDLLKKATMSLGWDEACD